MILEVKNKRINRGGGMKRVEIPFPPQTYWCKKHILPSTSDLQDVKYT